jgi:hypothetical protein
VWLITLNGVYKQVSSIPNPGSFPLSPALSGYNYYYYHNTIHTSITTMYRQAMLARTALRVSRTRGFATAAETAPEDFASARKAVKAHAVGMSPRLSKGQADDDRDY